MAIVRPTIEGSRPNWRSQKASLSTTIDPAAAALPGSRSSSGTNSRPAAGATPSTEK
jgi:hypothetical protein